jgi:hypothetical protein
MDSGDKATNKAMSAAYKYAAFQIFAIPTEGNPDADAETHEVASKPITPTDGAMELLDAEQQAKVNEVADGVRRGFASRGAEAAAAYIKDQNFDDMEEVAFWGLLKADSKMRAAIRTAQANMRASAA